MKLFSRIALGTFLAFVISVAGLPHLSPTESSHIPIVRSFHKDGDCHINICFAIDGSASISNSEFEMEKSFVIDVTSIVAAFHNATYSAVQYGLQSYQISSPTQDINEFLLGVHGTRLRGDPKSSLGAGIEHCFFELANARQGVSKIVLIGDGRHNHGRDPMISARIFKQFFGENGSLSVINVGHSNLEYMTDLANAGGGDVFPIDDFIGLPFFIDDIVFDICG